MATLPPRLGRAGGAGRGNFFLFLSRWECISLFKAPLLGAQLLPATSWGAPFSAPTCHDGHTDRTCQQPASDGVVACPSSAVLGLGGALTVKRNNSLTMELMEAAAGVLRSSSNAAAALVDGGGHSSEASAAAPFDCLLLSDQPVWICGQFYNSSGGKG